jgi:hypothetical protein
MRLGSKNCVHARSMWGFLVSSLHLPETWAPTHRVIHLGVSHAWYNQHGGRIAAVDVTSSCRIGFCFLFP